MTLLLLTPWAGIVLAILGRALVRRQQRTEQRIRDAAYNARYRALNRRGLL